MAETVNYRTNNQLVQSFGVNNLNELTTSGRSGTLTVAGSVGQAPPPVSVNVSGTGLSSGAATLYEDGSWARAGATLADGQNSYTANATDGYSRTSQDTVNVNLPSSVSFHYDGNGNLTNDGLRVFEYDTENQLISITVSNGWRSEFAYDGFMRRRIRREFTWSGGAWLNTNEVRHLYDSLLVVQERNPMNISLVSYTRGIDLSGRRHGAGGIGGFLARSDSAVFGASIHHAFYHCDGNGNCSCLVNQSNRLVASYTYDPSGNTISASGELSSLNLYRFSSKETHANSGMIYYLYRFHCPSLQKWLNIDPGAEAGFQIARMRTSSRPQHSIRGFVFVNNASLNNFDSIGLAALTFYDPNGPNATDTTMDDCLDECDQSMRIAGIEYSKKAAGGRAKGYIAGLLIITGGAVLAIPPPTRVAGYVAMAVGVVAEGVQWLIHSHEDSKFNEDLRAAFVDCCGNCGVKYGDMQAAADHVDVIFPK